MKYGSESAIEKHYLESILPHPTYPVQSQIPKTKDFYQPDQFIWNNPHRVSHQMYKFYHAYNDQYQKYKQPIIKQQESNDREQSQMQRIHRLIAFRNKTRDEFLKKQRTRELLESKLKQETRNVWRNVKTDNEMLQIQSQYNHLTEVEDIVSPQKPKIVQKSARVLRIEDTFKDGLKKYDIKTEEIHKLINNQHDDYHRKIRSQFAARKNVNDSTNTRFYSKLKKNSVVNG